MKAPLAGQVALVTGAASGIGRAIAAGLIADGARVAGLDVNPEGLGEIAGLLPIVGDVADPASVERAAAATVAELGGLHVLFNNAGYGLTHRIEDLESGEFERLVAVHLFGTLYGIRSALSHMRAAGYGRIINTLSRAAEVGPPGSSAYAAAKAAMWALTRCAAQETADADILVNGLIPGPTNTAIWGRDRPEMQAPEAVYPTARMLATLPAGGPSGRVFWKEKEYPMFRGVSAEGV